MPVAGSEIVKLLPGKRPCKDCGFPTCFAFAMKLASGGTTVDKCPYLSDEVKAKLTDLLAPPVKLVTVGSGDNALKVGNEEVVYRHEKTFVHSPGIALLISDKEDSVKIGEKIRKIKELQFPWVGVNLKADLLALQFESGDKNKFLALVKKVYDSTDVGLVLISEDTDALFAARDICADRHPLLYPITKENVDEAIPKVKANMTPVGLRGTSVEELIPLTTRLKDAGIEELVLDPGSKNLLEAVRDETFIRKAALKQGFILERLSGEGMVFLHCCGDIVELNLAPDEVVRVETGLVVGFESTVDYSIDLAGGVKTVLFGGEGLFLTTLKGPGKVVLQSMDVAKLANSLLPYLPRNTSGNSGFQIKI